MRLGRLFEHEVDSELAAEADGGPDIHILPGLNAEGNLAVKHIGEHLHVRVKGGHGVPAGGTAIAVQSCIIEGLAEDRSDSHTGRRTAGHKGHLPAEGATIYPATTVGITSH